VWALWDDLSNQVIGRRLDGIPTVGGPPAVFGPSDPFPFVDVAAVPGVGWIVAWGSVHGAEPGTFFARYHTGAESDSVTVLDADTVARALAVSDDGARVAVVGTGPKDVDPQTEIWLRFVTPSGAPLGGEILLHTAATAVAPDAAFDEYGNLYVVWTEDGVGLRAVGVDPAGVPSGPPVTLHVDADVGGLVRTVRTRDAEPFAPSRFVNAWTSFDNGAGSAQLATLCSPGTSTCGDGVRNAFCEACDDGPANDDAAPDTCRTDCRPARCGDGTIDTGEACDDGNRASCDGCSAACAVEIGLGCGDAIPFPTCGEPCDDGNAVPGDGCSPTCALEFVPGGGSPVSDCLTAFTVGNPTNTPLLDSRGQFRAKHVCVDDDPACDQDGGTPGSCTLAVRVCANASTLPACTPNGRLSSWTLNAPSAANAAKKPALAVVRDALLTAVPGTIVGPDASDVCSAPVPVVIPLRGGPGAWRQGKMGIKTTVHRYDGAKDADKLDLRCDPAP
jgi:cysteine-rich repeat protein